MRHRLLTLLFLQLCPITLAAQTFYVPPAGFAVDDPVLRHIWAIGMDSSQVEPLAQVLMDSIGPRLTGSPGLDAAQAWLTRMYGSWQVPVRRERYGTWRSWRRGLTHIDLVAPRLRALDGRMLAWSAGTPGGRMVRAPVVALPDLPDSAAFAAWMPQVRGKAVLVSFAEPTCRPDTSWDRYAVPEAVDSLKHSRTVARKAWNARITRTGYEFSYGRHSLLHRLAAVGAAALLTSEWSQGWGGERVFGTDTRDAPVIGLTCEDYGLLFRLAEHRQGPVVELEARSEAGGEVPVFNVIGEIKGRELPGEYVVLSAHLDSWDGASGATDNGSGTVMVMEAMRILAKAYPTPRRTILAGHWSGEEQGLEGARAFVADHPVIIDSLQAAFNQDAGTGRATAMSAAGFVRAAGNLARYISRIPGELTRDIHLVFPGPSGPPDDYAAFIGCGAPAFDLDSDDWDYIPYTWHSNLDTYDKLSLDDMKRNATLLAMLAYLSAEDTEFMSRERRTVYPPSSRSQPRAWLEPECRQPDRSTASGEE